ncbi:sel1 repeat family protein [Patescibacteria group bacterium]|nr:sel1 repeat family protein [Patescibacteria group bacterium]
MRSLVLSLATVLQKLYDCLHRSSHMKLRIVIIGSTAILALAGCSTQPSAQQDSISGDTPIATLEREAAEGNVRAQAILASKYVNGEGVLENSSKAAQLYRTAAEQGDGGSQFMLGLMYSIGEGVPQDDAEAIRWYEKASEQGVAGATYQLGRRYFLGEYGITIDREKGMTMIRKAAESDEQEAQIFMGYMYDKGNGVPQDGLQAIDWYTKAANQGNAEAQFRIGHMYFTGESVTQDYPKALEWYEKAAHHGVVGAQHGLALMYYGGDMGVPSDYIQSYMWANLAAAQGEEDSKALLNLLARKNDARSDCRSATPFQRILLQAARMKSPYFL